MANEMTHAIQGGNSVEVGDQFEQTRPGPFFTPAVDIFEKDEAITLLADMPGVKSDDLEIDLRENILTLNGRCESFEVEGETDVVREYETGTYHRRFTLSDTIDQDKIEAKLVDGVLRLELPKSEETRPRQIPVMSE